MGQLPQLNFHDNEFDLALCSHYLFLYSAQIDQQAHIDAILELLRVAREVRIYPLVELDNSISRHLETILAYLDLQQFKYSLIDVDYQFQKGATSMLVIHSAQ